MSETLAKNVKGYKVFNPDWTCRGFRYEVGGIYEENVKPKVCERGFHFCEKAADCFNYYSFNSKNKVAEVIALGEVVSAGIKSCTNKIQIVREIPWQELLEIVNTGKSCTGLYNSGNWNSGDCNSGNRNSGNWNSGDCNSGNCNSGNYNSGNYNSGNRNSGDYNSGNCNSGDCNSGNCNSGNYNSGNYNSGNYNSGNRNSGDYNSGDWNKTNFSNGCFNTVEPKIYLFNKPSEWTYKDWLNSEVRDLLNYTSGDVLKYIWFDDMTDEEKAEHPEAKTTGGYLKMITNGGKMQEWYDSLSDNDKNIIKSIPNFDKEIFKEITGIDVDNKDE